MIKSNAGRMVLAASALALVLAAGACADPEAAARAEAEAQAKIEKKKAEDKTKRQIAHDVECLSALRWQKAALAGAGIGNVDLYTAHFREDLETTLGSQLFTSEAPKPSLSRATLEDYLEWSYKDDVETRFTAGKDFNNDGAVSGAERSDRGFSTVTACVQEVAELGKGPLAGKDKVARMFKIKELRAKLKDKGV